MDTLGRLATPSLALLTIMVIAGRPASSAEFHVSPDGSDDNPGTKPAPFATLKKARDVLRASRRADEPACILVHAGTYRLSEPLELTAEDSGTEAAPVIWQAARGEDVRLMGGVRLTDLQPVTDPAVRERLAPEARDGVRQVDLKALGLTDFGDVGPTAGRHAELLFDHRYMPLARYPNEGWLRIADVPQEGELQNAGRHDDGVPVVRDGVPYGRHYGRFTYDGDRPAGWRDADDLWVHGYWVYDWRDEYQRVQRIDREKREIWPQPPYHGYGYSKGQRYYFLNILEELDQPGEWYVDRQTGILYFWPPGPIEPSEAIFPDLGAPMLALTDTQYIHIRGFVFEGSRAGAVTISGGSGNEIAGCTIRNVGDPAVSIAGGSRNGVRDCDIYEVAGGGISLSGGDRKTLARSDHYSINNHIHHFGRLFKTYRPGVSLDGVGQLVSHCYIHDCPHSALGYSGNEHTVEFSEFERVALETGDVGCIYTAMDWTYMGEVFRYNYFHNIHGPGALGSMTIYLDLPCGGAHVYGNVFRDMDRAFFTNSGRDCLIENNIFIECHPSVQLNRYWLESLYREGGDWRMVERLAEVHHDQPPYSTRYPGLLRLFHDGDPSIPTGNMVRRNISMGGSFLELEPLVDFEDVKVEGNLIADPVVFTGSLDGSGQGGQYGNGDTAVERELGRYGNVIVDGDPGFVDAAADDFRLKPGSPAQKLGFEPIPFDEIGLQVNEDRLDLPVRTPSIEPGTRLFVDELRVRLSAGNRGGDPVLRYTLDGSEPTEGSPRYARPIRLADTTTVKATAFSRHGVHERSDTVSATYTLARLGPEHGVHVSDLPALDVLAHAGLKRDTNYSGSGPIRLVGRDYPKGIMVHPEVSPEGGIGHVTYALDGGLREARVFRAVVGVDEADGPVGTVTFAVEVYRDGEWRRVFESGVLKGGEAEEVSVDIAGAERIRLLTTDAGDGINSDCAVWADAKIQ